MDMQGIKNRWDEIAAKFMERFARVLAGELFLKTNSSQGALKYNRKRLGNSKEERRIISALLNTTLS